jgi:hypothetical protein
MVLHYGAQYGTLISWASLTYQAREEISQMAQFLKVECIACDISGVAIIKDGVIPYCHNCNTPAKVLGE